MLRPLGRGWGGWREGTECDSSGVCVPVFRPEGSGLLHGHPVQLGHLQGDLVYGARADGSLPPRTLLRWLGRQAALDPSDLPALVCLRLCRQAASPLTQGSNKLKVPIVIYMSVTE